MLDDSRLEGTVDWTPARGCPDCEAKRLHTKENWEAHHPYARHGYSTWGGWSHEELKEGR